MSDILAAAWGTPGLWALMATILVAGVVRGFSGFGTGLIFIPLAATFIEPLAVLVCLIVVDLVGSAPLVPRAVRDARMRDVGLMALGCMVTLPLGTVLLTTADPAAFRWIASAIALGLVLVLASGWRHHLEIGPGGLAGIGGLSGLMGGFTGIPGPPVIIAYMSGQYGPGRIRATILLYLLAFEGLLALTFWLRGVLEPGTLALGALLVPAYAAGNLIGAALFRPEMARTYRAVAYGIIIVSALAGLPLFGD